MNNNSIKILCPPKSCGKCQRLIRKVEEMLKENALHAEIIVVKAMDEVQKYPTWILPTVVISAYTKTTFFTSLIRKRQR